MSTVPGIALGDPTIDFRRDIDPNSLYELTSLLGEGSYGAVYSARPRNLPSVEEEVAVKIIPDADEDLTALWKEIRFLQVLRSPFVVSFIESLLFDNELWLVMELCDGGSLHDLKEANKTVFNEPQLKAIMAFSSMGLAHLHAQMSIHRDVKSGNILLTRDGKAKLGDFGISAQLTDTINKRKTVIGSPYWMAPEVIQETSYDGKADIWSLGITLLELCEGSPPLFSVHPMRAIFIISSRPAPTLKEPEKWSAEMRDFVERCLVKDCDKRASAAELVKHPWIKSCVNEIGASGRGLPILRDLIEENWASIQRLRASKMPANIGADTGRSGDGPDLDSATLRRSLSGIPATRQQIRNASLKRPYSGSHSDGMGTLVMRTNSVRVDTLVNDAKDAQHKADFFDNKQADGTLLSSVVRHGNTFSQGAVGAKEAGREMQAALKYFRDDALLPEPKFSSPKKESKGVQDDAIPQAPHLIQSTNAIAEGALLNEMMVNENSQESVEMMRKEIMSQIASLKKQYREDLETLTNSYESRRKVLKDALLNLTTPAPDEAPTPMLTRRK